MRTKPDPLRERIARHGLADRAAASPVQAVELTTALQAQDNQASRFGVRARAAGVTEADVVAAIDGDRSIVRTWLLRGTIHLVAAADLRWLVALIGPVIVRKFRTRWRQLGLSDALLDRIVAALPAVLADGPRTRREIRAALAAQGVLIDSPDPQAHTHAVVYASSTGLICRGPDRGRDATFVLVDDWLPKLPRGPTGEDAVAELARRFFAAYSPATAADFATWSGLPGAKSVRLIADELSPVQVYGQAGYRLGAAEPARGVRLLPAFDNYLLGYKERSGYVPPERHREVFDGGIIRSVVLADGRVIGRWTLDRVRGRVRLDPWAEWPAAVWRAVQREVADLGRFLGREVAMER